MTLRSTTECTYPENRLCDTNLSEQGCRKGTEECLPSGKWSGICTPPEGCTKAEISNRESLVAPPLENIVDKNALPIQNQVVVDANIIIHSLSSIGKTNKKVFGSQLWVVEKFLEEGSGSWDYQIGHVSQKYYYNEHTKQYCFPALEDCNEFSKSATHYIPFAMKEKIQEAGISVLRFPAGLEATGYDWKLFFGPIGGRKKYRLDHANEMVPYFGVGEFLKLCEETNAIADFVVSVREPQNRDCRTPLSVLDLGDLVAFAKCPYTPEVENYINLYHPEIKQKDFIFNRHIHDWQYYVGIRKYIYNHEEPFPLYYIELDNEVSDGFFSPTYCDRNDAFYYNIWYEGLSQTNYIQKFNEYSNVVKHILQQCGLSKNSIKIGMDTHYRYRGWDEVDKLIMGVKQNYDLHHLKPDYFVWHRYAEYGHTVTNDKIEPFTKRKLSADLSFQEDIHKFLDIIDRHFGKDNKITLALTEFSLSYEYPAVDEQNSWDDKEFNKQVALRNSIAVAVATASLYEVLLDPENRTEFATSFFLTAYSRWNWGEFSQTSKGFGNLLNLIVLPYTYHQYDVTPFYKKIGKHVQYFQERPNYMVMKLLSQNLQPEILGIEIKSPTFSNKGLTFGRIADYENVPLINAIATYNPQNKILTLHLINKSLTADLNVGIFLPAEILAVADCKELSGESPFSNNEKPLSAEKLYKTGGAGYEVSIKNVDCGAALSADGKYLSLPVKKSSVKVLNVILE